MKNNLTDESKKVSSGVEKSPSILSDLERVFTINEDNSLDFSYLKNEIYFKNNLLQDTNHKSQAKTKAMDSQFDEVNQLLSQETYNLINNADDSKLDVKDNCSSFTSSDYSEVEDKHEVFINNDH